MARRLIISGIGRFGYVAGLMSGLLDAPHEKETDQHPVVQAIQRVEARLDHIGGN